MKICKFYLLIFWFSIGGMHGQYFNANISGVVLSDNQPLPFVNIIVQKSGMGCISDTIGKFFLQNIPPSSYTLTFSAIGYQKKDTLITLEPNQNLFLQIELLPQISTLEDVVLTGTMKEVSKLESVVPVEVYSANFFKANPTPSVFDALQNINGVRPQLNCNICNTGDIHINGLEGPYAMVTIDGMPIVSGLSTVYGLYGIPSAMIDRIEIVKGPASTLYGSEAVAGLINIITKKPTQGSSINAEIQATTWAELNTDFTAQFPINKNIHSLLGINYFNYSFPKDYNHDGFTDVTLQQRIALFNKWNVKRPFQRLTSWAARYLYEDRWGGEMTWNKNFRGTDSIYGESIFTHRWEIFGNYQLPTFEKIILQFSANGHYQNSYYGITPYFANQTINFVQMTWYKDWKNHQLLVGLATRYTYYDDNTPATQTFDTLTTPSNKPSKVFLPGLFVQDEITLHPQHKLLIGVRYDYHSVHKNILTPRLNYKWNSENLKNVLRLSLGNGYRVANIFTEDHAALTGARNVEFLENLKPETSWNTNLNFIKKFFLPNGTFIGADASVFYTYFTNKIIADYETDPNKIIYQNLAGYAISQGVSLNMEVSFPKYAKMLFGGTYLDVYSVQNNEKLPQLLTERFTAVWNLSINFFKERLIFHYTGNLYSPMRLPLLGNNDPRSPVSPWWSIQNLQCTYKTTKNLEFFIGIKNLLNWTPAKNVPFIIARASDPFDKSVVFDMNGQPIITPDNPYGLTFDPTYVYAPNQEIRAYFGLRYQWK